MRSLSMRRAGATAAMVLALAAASGRAAATCVGDCDGDNRVAINELISGVAVSLGTKPMTACPAFDADDNGAVAINEIVAGVAAATSGCIPRGGGGQMDTTPPSMTQAWALTSTSVLVSFSEPLLFDEVIDLSAEDPANYSLDPATVVTGARLTPARTQVLLSTLPMVAGLEYVVAGTDSLKDEAGNRLVAGPTTAPDYPRNAQRFVFSGDAGVDSKPPRVSSAASQSNTTVLVQFSKPMHVNATEASAYVIVQANVNPEAGALLVDTAEFVGSDFSRVRLTTKSQNELLYEVTVVNVTDRAGVPLAAKEIVAGAVIDPSTATFPGTPPNAGADEDMDGLADNLEQRGWVVTVTLLDGSTEQRQVTSNPDLGDTDGDGLSDYEEAQLRTNPRDRDTDNDLLDDGFEWNELYSNPVAQDTDGDGLLDAYEVQSTKTSPLVDDTDGDGLTDGDELFAFNRDPLIADIPAVVIEVGDVRLQIEETFTYTDEQGNSVSESNTTNTALTRGSNSSFLVDWHERHDNTTKFVSGGITLGIDGSGVDEKSCPSVGVCVGGITVLGHVEGGQQWDEGDTWMDGGEAATESARAFEETAEEVRERTSSNSVTREVIGARMDVDVTIKNSGDLAFTVRDLQVTVLQRNPLDTRGLIPVATLVSNGSWSRVSRWR